MKTKSFGKSSSALLKQKKSFFEENRKHLEYQQRIALIYAKQPTRKNCKNCNSAVDVKEGFDFQKGGIEYTICNTCKHLNGIYDDTSSFCEAVYTEDKGAKYGETYSSKDISSYHYRTTSIYVPKAEFLYTTLLANNVDPNELEFLDFGAGSGYFISALRKIGLNNISGTEVSLAQVKLGNKMLNEELLKIHKIENTIEVLRNTTAQVISMIGVLEHLQYPREALRAIKDNNIIKYLYISVPLFSLSVFLEMLSPDIFHRHLSGTHTHLYTPESLQHLANEFELNVLGEWWFGTDIVDLFRHCHVNMVKSNASQKVIETFSNKIVPIIDALQLEIDKNLYSSEVHILFSKK